MRREGCPKPNRGEDRHERGLQQPTVPSNADRQELELSSEGAPESHKSALLEGAQAERLGNQPVTRATLPNTKACSGKASHITERSPVQVPERDLDSLTSRNARF